jgi:hypothetical protein
MVSLAHKTPSYNTKMENFVKFKIGDSFKQNIDETHSKQPKSIGRAISVDFKNLTKKFYEPKVSILFKMFVISKNNTIH